MRMSRWRLAMARRTDFVLRLLKWPAAIALLVALPGAVVATIALVGRIVADPLPALPFLGGFVLYAILWRLLFRSPAFGTIFSTFEHELTHGLFALLTFHGVSGLRATWKKGGSILIHGGDNWVITAAPYFFPTFSISLMLVLALAPATWISTLAAVLGFSLSYHVISTIKETHRGQPDLKQIGFRFALAALPTLNIVLGGIVVAFAWGGWPSVRMFLGQTVERTTDWMSWIFG